MKKPYVKPTVVEVHLELLQNIAKNIHNHGNFSTSNISSDGQADPCCYGTSRSLDI